MRPISFYKKTLLIFGKGTEFREVFGNLLVCFYGFSFTYTEKVSIKYEGFHDAR